MGGHMTKTNRGIVSIAPGGKSDGAADEVLTLVEAADFAKVSERTLWQLAKDQEVPHKRVGAQYRFLKSKLLEWMTS